MEKSGEVAEKFFSNRNGKTLRDFLEPLDLNFDPEEFISTEESLELSPGILAIGVYMDKYPETLGRFASEQIYEEYVEPYGDGNKMDRQDDFFMITEYIHRYY